MKTKVHIVIGWDDVWDVTMREEVKGVWFDRASAEKHKKKCGHIRVEEHVVRESSDKFFLTD